MTAALEGVSGQQHAPAALYPRERPGTHFTGGWLGPKAGLDGRKISFQPDSIPDCPSFPEGSRKLRFPDFTTMAQDGGKVVTLMHRPPLPPRNAPGTHFC